MSSCIRQPKLINSPPEISIIKSPAFQICNTQQISQSISKSLAAPISDSAFSDGRDILLRPASLPHSLQLDTFLRLAPGLLPRRHDSPTIRPPIRLRRHREAAHPRAVRRTARNPPQPRRNRQISSHRNSAAGRLAIVRDLGNPVQLPRNPNSFLRVVAGD